MFGFWFGFKIFEYNLEVSCLFWSHQTPIFFHLRNGIWVKFEFIQ